LPKSNYIWSFSSITAGSLCQFLNSIIISSHESLHNLAYHPIKFFQLNYVNEKASSLDIICWVSNIHTFITLQTRHEDIIWWRQNHLYPCNCGMRIHKWGNYWEIWWHYPSANRAASGMAEILCWLINTIVLNLYLLYWYSVPSSLYVCFFVWVCR